MVERKLRKVSNNLKPRLYGVFVWTFREIFVFISVICYTTGSLGEEKVSNVSNTGVITYKDMCNMRLSDYNNLLSKGIIYINKGEYVDNYSYLKMAANVVEKLRLHEYRGKINLQSDSLYDVYCSDFSHIVGILGDFTINGTYTWDIFGYIFGLLKDNNATLESRTFNDLVVLCAKISKRVEYYFGGLAIEAKYAEDIMIINDLIDYVRALPYLKRDSEELQKKVSELVNCNHNIEKLKVDLFSSSAAEQKEEDDSIIIKSFIYEIVDLLWESRNLNNDEVIRGLIDFCPDVSKLSELLRFYDKTLWPTESKKSMGNNEDIVVNTTSNSVRLKDYLAAAAGARRFFVSELLRFAGVPTFMMGLNCYAVNRCTGDVLGFVVPEACKRAIKFNSISYFKNDDCYLSILKAKSSGNLNEVVENLISMYFEWGVKSRKTKDNAMISAHRDVCGLLVSILVHLPLDLVGENQTLDVIVKCADGLKADFDNVYSIFDDVILRRDFIDKLCGMIVDTKNKMGFKGAEQSLVLK